MSSQKLRVVHEDNHLLVVAKPAGVPTMGAAPGVETVVDQAKSYLGTKYNKPGSVYLGVVSRLDSPVTGLLLFARTSKAASRLTDAFGTRRVDKRYLATVAGEAPPCEEPIVHYVRKDDNNQRMHTTQPNAPGAKRAELSYRVLLTYDGRSLLEVQLITGRKHQIRVQLAKLGMPILGDEKYAGQELDGDRQSFFSYKPGIALHSWRLELEHPVKRDPLKMVCPPAESWGRWRPNQLKEALSQIRG